MTLDVRGRRYNRVSCEGHKYVHKSKSRQSRSKGEEE